MIVVPVEVQRQKQHEKGTIDLLSTFCYAVRCKVVSVQARRWGCDVVFRISLFEIFVL